MHLNTFVYTTTMFALANATPAVARSYGNLTMTDIPTLASTESANWETIPSLSASNSTTSSISITTSDIFQITTTSVDKTTLTYTLGPSGSSSVVTTVIENTSTITMTSTLYVTMTRPADEPSSVPAPTGSQFSDDPLMSIEPTGEPTLTGDDNEATETATAESTAFEFTEGPTAAPTSIEAIDGQDFSSTGSFDNPSATLEPTVDDSGDLSGSGPDSTVFNSAETTVTVTDLLTTTETVTVEAVPTINPGAFFQSDASGTGSFHPGSGSGPDFWSSIISSFLGGHGTSCGVTTITTTIVDMSTVTVTPTSTGNVPYDPTASPSFGSGNSTTAYPTASSGFLTFLKRSRPTLI